MHTKTPDLHQTSIGLFLYWVKISYIDVSAGFGNITYLACHFLGDGHCSQLLPYHGVAQTQDLTLLLLRELQELIAGNEECFSSGTEVMYKNSQELKLS